MYKFENKPFEWEKEGTNPSDSEKYLGLQGGMALPAAFVNQQWYLTYKAIAEIQNAIETGQIGVDTVNGIFTNSLNVGVGNTANNLNTVVGKYAKTPTEANATTNTGDVFVVGNGIQGGARSNALRVTATGQVMGTQAYAATGADITHEMEWLDGNPNNEDRRGFFVTTVGKKIRIANSSDNYILGVVSGMPSLICNAATDEWRGKYVTDEFGTRVMENGVYKLSEEFDPTLNDTYTSSLERSEKGLVGHSGIVIARDDGTCIVDGFCLQNDEGVATKAETGYRVMERLSENRILIFVSEPLIINK